MRRTTAAAAAAVGTRQERLQVLAKLDMILTGDVARVGQDRAEFLADPSANESRSHTYL